MAAENEVAARYLQCTSAPLVPFAVHVVLVQEAYALEADTDPV